MVFGKNRKLKMELPKRISLNTSMKNANIFKDDSDDEGELMSSFQQRLKEKLKQHETPKAEPITKIKQENFEDEGEALSSFQERLKKKLKQESPNDEQIIKIKQEIIDYEGSMTPPSPPSINSNDITLPDIKIKLESEYNSSDNCDIALERLGLQTPIKTEEENVGKSNLKSAKRTLLKQRNSPYAKAGSTSNRDQSSGERKGKKKKWEYSNDDKDNTDDPKKMRKRSNSERRETDPIVLARRQKQIDFGKNTLGYENYIQQVPKDKRSPEDPATPNKYRVYSRRGFDGLIKQWRLKLHKYDP